MRSSKINKKIFENLKDKAELSTDKGEILREQRRTPNSKTRRHSGRIEIYVDDEDYPFQATYYSEWDNYRDGHRDFDKLEQNKLIKQVVKQLKLRKKRKKLA